ncbi:ARI5A protein, partial [Nyctiprogne leucopyga]|nr:ARI5A protein [Nyctiprogne leucopyga]
MSPLAKKKLLAQVSRAESWHCHKRHLSQGRRPASDAGPSPQPPRPLTGSHHDGKSPEPSGAPDTAPSVGSEVGSEVGPIPSASPCGGDSQPCPRAEEGAPAPTVFTGCFHAYRHEVLKPVSCPPLWGYFSSLKDFLEPSSSTFPSRTQEPGQPQDLRNKAEQSWSGENRRAAVKACWVPPGATFSPATPRGKRGREEEEAACGPGVKLRGISPFIKEADGRDTGASSLSGQQRLAKPKAVVASPGYPTPLPQAPDVYKGAMLHFPASFGSSLEHLKTQGVPVASSSLSLNPFIIPAFPSPLVATSMQPSDVCRPLATGPGRYPASYESSLRHRLYPAATWHNQPPSSSLHRHTKL